MNPRKGYRENVAEQERRMIELEHKLEVVTRQRDQTIDALSPQLSILSAQEAFERVRESFDFMTDTPPAEKAAAPGSAIRRAILHCPEDEWDGKEVEIVSGPVNDVWVIKRGRRKRASFTDYLELKQ